MMNKHITILFLLSFAFTVLSAPVVTLHTPKKQGRCIAGGGLKRSPSASSASSKSHAQNLHKRTPEFDDSSLEYLFRRADTQLCDMNFRGHSSRNCDGSRGYINGVWHTAGKFKTGGLECDHILELQLIKTALENAGFCTAWETIEKKWAAKDPSAGAKAKMKAMFDASLKLKSNLPSNMMWVDGTFNGQKRAFFAAKIKPTPTTTAAPANIKRYFEADVKGKAASVAALVDSQASELLGQVVAAATDGYECDPEKPGPHFDYVTELEHIEISFPSQPVSNLWKKVEAYL